MSLKSLCLAASLVVWSLNAQADEPTIERWDRVVCLLEERTNEAGKPSGDAGAAFLVADKGGILLVTTAHNARFTTGKTLLMFRDPAGQSHAVALGELAAEDGIPWRYHDQADVAVMPMMGNKLEPGILKSLSALAISTDAIVTDVPRRTTPIEIVGFPMLFGVRPAVSPLVLSGYVASRETSVDASWGRHQIVFTYPVVGPGCGGGPAFVSAEDSADVAVMGMCMGYQQDKTGFKLTKLVPGKIVLDLIRQQDASAIARIQ